MIRANNSAIGVVDKTIDLNSLETPLRMIVGLSCLAFVICLGFEILSLYGLQSAHLYLTITVPLVLLLWALTEHQILSKSQKGIVTTNLLIGLLIFLLLVAARALIFFLSEAPAQADKDFALATGLGFRWIFLLGYTVVFIAISQAVIELFLLNEKNRANTREEQLLSSLNALAMARDNETGNHILRTQHYVRVLALRLRIMKQQ